MKTGCLIIFVCAGIIFIPILYNYWNSKHIAKIDIEKYIEAKNLLNENYDTIIKLRNLKLKNITKSSSFNKLDSNNTVIHANRGDFGTLYLDSTITALVKIHNFYKDGVFSSFYYENESYIAFTINKFKGNIFENNEYSHYLLFDPFKRGIKTNVEIYKQEYLGDGWYYVIDIYYE